jgi:hypothetical protein
VSFENPHRLSRLDEERFIVFEFQKGADKGIETLPVPGGLSRASVDDEVIGFFTVLGVQVITEHPEGSFLVPPLTVQLPPARCPHRAGFSTTDLKFVEKTFLGGRSHDFDLSWQSISFIPSSMASLKNIRTPEKRPIL